MSVPTAPSLSSSSLALSNLHHGSGSPSIPSLPRLLIIIESALCDSCTSPDSSVVHKVGPLLRPLARLVHDYARQRYCLFRFGGFRHFEIDDVLSSNMVTFQMHDIPWTGCLSTLVPQPSWYSRKMHETRRNFTASPIGSSIYLAGGLSCSECKNGTESVISAELSVFDAIHKTWTSLPRMSRVRLYHCAIVVAGVLVVCGGNAAGGAAISDCEAYDPDRALWSTLPPLHHARSHHMLVEYMGRLYCFGGHSASIISDEAVTVTERLDSLTAEWWRARLSPIPEARSLASSIVLFTEEHTCIAILGGQNSTDSTTFSSILLYHVASDTWIPCAWTLPSPLCDFSAYVTSEALVIAGGSCDEADTSACYSTPLPQTMEQTHLVWTRLPDLPEAVHGAAGCMTSS